MMIVSDKRISVSRPTVRYFAVLAENRENHFLSVTFSLKPFKVIYAYILGLKVVLLASVQLSVV